jgi:hypothetical protein
MPVTNLDFFRGRWADRAGSTAGIRVAIEPNGPRFAVAVLERNAVICVTPSAAAEGNTIPLGHNAHVQLCTDAENGRRLLRYRRGTVDVLLVPRFSAA